MRRPPSTFRLAALSCALVLVLLPPAARLAPAADLTIALPTVTAPPGATVLVPILTTPGPAGLGITAVEFRIDFAPGVISASASHADGWLQSWGDPFVNANASFLAAAAAGFPAISSGGGLLNTISLTVSPSATNGTDMPIAFHHITCNEGDPDIAVTPGLLRVRTTADAGSEPLTGLALSAPVPNPVTTGASFALSVPDGPPRPASVAIHALDGRLVRELSRGPLGAGRHELRWDGRDAGGDAAPAGVYFARASVGRDRLVRRLVVVR